MDAGLVGVVLLSKTPSLSVFTSVCPFVLQNWTSARHDIGFLCIKVLFVCLADIRLQLSEQLRCLDVRMESQVAVVAELQDYFRRRAEVELDYSKNLDKLAKSLQLRHKEQKQKWVW